MNVTEISDLPSLSQIRTGQSSVSGISVIIPVHNAVATLEATLHSLIQQSHADWEAIIIDDGSTDGTAAIANDWAQRDSRFRILHQDKRGVSAARNHGLEEARYPYILFLDGDDRIAPAHLQRMLEKLSSDPELDAVHCGWQDILPSGIPGRAHFGSDD
ncbi:MAG TPA: glycosyltransferase family 2 protein, partial [Chthoniobacterales bacterium]|nr:glycosyltransferase family 2 protein [Chthoniobacterales bacterium]